MERGCRPTTLKNSMDILASRVALNFMLGYDIMVIMYLLVLDMHFSIFQFQFFFYLN